MNWYSKFLAFTLVSTISTQSAMARTFTLLKSDTGTVNAISGEAAAPKVGNLIGSNLYITIDNDVVEIKERTADGAEHTITSGNAFNLHIKNENSEAFKLEGYCFLNAGDKLSQMIGADANTADLILCTDGQKLTGHITAVDKKLLSIQENGATKLVRVRDIRSIASGHVFHLSAYIFPTSEESTPGATAMRAKILRFDLDQTLDDFMTATGKRRLETAISAAGYTKWQRAALIGASVLITGAAIAVPVAVAAPLVGRHLTAEKSPPSSLEVIQR